MAQTGYTPISLYYTTTAAAVPTSGNLVNGELAINITDGKLYYKNNSGVVTLLAGATSGPAGGSTTQVQYNNAGVLAGITGATSNGTALTLVAPVLGTPASATLTNATGLPISTGVSGLGTSVATALGVNVGTAGAFVVNGGALGSPSSAGTIPAFTLGGTVSGGGNQLNNVIIGTTTPLAGAFTTLSASSAITSTVTSGEAFKIGSSSAGTGILYMDMFNTSGGLYLGLEGSAGGTLWTGIPAYATGLGARTTGGGISFSANSTTQHMLLTTTGLAVTGTLSSTGNATFSAAQGQIYFSGATNGQLAAAGDLFLDSGVAKLMYFRPGGTTAMTLDSSGNLGLGVTPSAASVKTFEIGTIGNGIESRAAAITGLTQNAYINTTFKYAVTGRPSSAFELDTGAFYWYTAASGTAGNNISFTQAMTLDASGNLLVGTTSAVTGSKLVVGSGDATIYGLTVGRGGGAVSTNTAVGASALAGSNTGAYNSAFGANALLVNTSGTQNTAIGGNTLQANTTGSYNAAFGLSAGYAITTGSYNTAIGQNALSVSSTGSYNTALGTGALQLNTTASSSTAVGFQAGYSNTTGGVTAVGRYALFGNTTGTDNVAMGSSALETNSTGTSNAAFGHNALVFNTTGSNNTAQGASALRNNTTGGTNVAVGVDSLRFNTTASNNTAVGYQAGYSNTTASYNTAVGHTASYSTTTGQFNTSVGQEALYYNTTGSNNTAIGRDALASNITASDNTAVGYQAGYLVGSSGGTQPAQSVFVGSGAGYTGAGNSVAVGYQALYTYANASGNCTAVGWKALNANITGSSNVAIGYSALLANSSAASNIGIGNQALSTNTGSARNIAIGHQSLRDFTGASGSGYNIAIGYQSQLTATGTSNVSVGGSTLSATSGTNNTAVGHNSGSGITSGAKNVILGSYTGAAAPISATGSNYIVLSDGDGNVRGTFDSSGNLGLGETSPVYKLHVKNAADGFISRFTGGAATTVNIGVYGNSTTGFGSIGTESNHEFRIFTNAVDAATFATGGNFTIVGATATKASGTVWANPSDQRLKDNICDYAKGTTELMQIRVREWEYNGKGGTTEGMKGLGVIADEVMTVLPNTVENYDAKLNADDEETTAIKKFDATEITWLLVKTVQEQQAVITTLTARITALEAK